MALCHVLDGDRHDLAVSILVTGSLDWMHSQGDARRIYMQQVMGGKLN
jgi:hypothetical protein